MLLDRPCFDPPPKGQIRGRLFSTAPASDDGPCGGRREAPPERRPESALDATTHAAVPDAIGAYRIGAEAGYGRSDLRLAHREGASGLGGDYTILPVLRGALEAAGGESAVVSLGRKAMGVRHPSLLRVCDVVSDGDWLGIVTEHSRGRSLASLAYSEAVLDPGPGERPAILTLCAVLLEAMHDVHQLFATEGQRGHGFMGPDAVVITSRGELKVAGVGLPMPDVSAAAPIRWGRRRNVPQQGDPKQAPLSDQFAVGLILLRLVTGRGFDNAIEEAAGEAKSDALRWTIGSVQLEDPILPVLLRLLANEPNHRFADCDTAARQLRHLAGPTGPVLLPQYLRRLVANRPPERSVADVTLEEMPLEELDLLGATDPGSPIPRGAPIDRGGYDDDEPSRVVSRSTLLAPPGEGASLAPLGEPPRRRWTDFADPSVADVPAAESLETEPVEDPGLLGPDDATAPTDATAPAGAEDTAPDAPTAPTVEPDGTEPPVSVDGPRDTADSLLQGSSALLDPDPAVADPAGEPPTGPAAAAPSEPPPPAGVPNLARDATATGDASLAAPSEAGGEWDVDSRPSMASVPDERAASIPTGQSTPGRTVPYSPAFVPKASTWRRQTPNLGPVSSAEPQHSTQEMPVITPPGGATTHELPEAAASSLIARAGPTDKMPIQPMAATASDANPLPAPRGSRAKAKKRARRRDPTLRKRQLRRRVLKRYAPVVIAASAFALVALLVLIGQLRKRLADPEVGQVTGSSEP